MKMLKFDSSHKRVKEDIATRTFKWVKRLVIGSIIVTFLSPFGVALYNHRPAPCDIEGDHAHLYIDNDTKIERYIDSESYHVKGMDRLEDYRMITEEEAELLKFENKNDLFRIDENYELLQDIQNKNNENHKEYRYSYMETIHWTTPIKVGKGWTVIHHYRDVERHSWTTDKSLNLTGEERDVDYLYYGYKVSKDENGKYVLEKSDLVHDLSELPEDYNYITKDFYVVVDANTKEEVDYEDGPKLEEEVEYTQEEVEDMLDDLDSNSSDDNNVKQY